MLENAISSSLLAIISVLLLFLKLRKGRKKINTKVFVRRKTKTKIVEFKFTSKSSSS